MKKLIFFLLVLVFVDIKLRCKPVGLANCRNTCFQNAFIQMVYQIDPLIDILLTQQNLYPQNSLGYTFQHLILDMMNAQKTNSIVMCGSPESPTNLQKFTNGVYECLNIEAGSQADLAHGLNGLIRALKETSDSNLISTLEMTKEITFYPPSEKPYAVNRLAVPFILLDDFGDTPDLRHYINKAFVTKKDWQDPRRKVTHKDVSLVHRFLSAPNFIGFVYRALPGQGFVSLKNTVFPDELNFTRYIKEKRNSPALYQLRAIGVHIPSGAGGHYFAVVRDRDGKLYQCNDSTIKEVSSWTEGIGTFNPAAFLYVLKKDTKEKDIPVIADPADLINKLNKLQEGLKNIERAVNNH